jgi:hypothetical protein
MIPFGVIVVHELSYEVPKVPFAQRHDAMEALRFDRPDEALGVRIAVRCGRRCANDANADRAKQLLHHATPLRIPIADQDSTRAKDIVVARSSSERLHDERLVRVLCRTQHVNAARMQLDDERRVVRQEPAVGLHLGGEKIGRQECRPMRAHEGHIIGRSRLGGKPAAFKMRANVERPRLVYSPPSKQQGPKQLVPRARRVRRCAGSLPI